jgi:glucosamine--fructose-6-phosphate aminotransferase (isomerizing)
VCGFVGLLLDRAEGSAPDLDALERASRRLADAGCTAADDGALTQLEALSYELVGWSGHLLLRGSDAAERVTEAADALNQTSRQWERCVADGGISDRDLEHANARLIRLKDAVWRLEEDALGSVPRATSLGGDACASAGSDEHLFGLWQISYLLRSIDRLEVRGRDSAGLSCLLSFADDSAWEHYWALLTQLGLREELMRRTAGGFLSGAARISAPTRSVLFTFKVAAEVGEMGYNTTVLRRQVTDDLLLQETLASPGVRVNFFAHTRWASNGVVNEANCHPVSDDSLPPLGSRDMILSVALNGDVDNHQELRQRLELDGYRISPSETTDAKVVPLVTRAAMGDGASLDEAYIDAVGQMEGSFAAVLHGSPRPDSVLLAQKGGGQSVYVGLVPQGYVYASEVYGLVELCNRYVSMETEAGSEVLALARGAPAWGSISVLEQSAPPIRMDTTRVRRAEITTRDIDRAGFPHFLLKEICESPASMTKTLRGKLSIEEGGRAFRLGESVVPGRLLEVLRSDGIQRLFVVGQGTAAVAGEGIANYMSEALGPRGIDVRSLKASELSGFHLAPEMADTVVVAVSQSGTTTDTNRTVDIVRARGAWVIGIVNRRDSALAEKVHGVFYTSDGRDVEMAVASTKAFYAQLAAGHVLALYLGQELGVFPSSLVRERLEELSSLPAKMERLLEGRDSIAKAARAWAPTRCHWAVVGSGPNRVAAEEIRIKLSELCYKSIASDHTEDKKHIDLSSEPLVLVCTAGLEGAALDDLVKEVAIFKAHRACPIVLIPQGEERFQPYAVETIVIPPASPRQALVLNTLAGHLWGYYSAVAQDEGAGLLRSIRREIVRSLRECEEFPLSEEGTVVESLLKRVRGMARKCLEDLGRGRFNSSLSAAVASRVSVVLHYLAGTVPWVQAERELGGPGTLSEMLGRILSELTAGVEETTRPVDAIKHQAKTVTVGISRLEEKPRGVLFDYLESIGVSLAHLTYSNLLLLRLLGPLVHEVLGSTRYALEDLSELGEPGPGSALRVTARFGVAEGMHSRAEGGCPLRGTKRRVVASRTVFAGVGGRDGRPVAIVPLIREGQPRELALLHLGLRGDASLHDKLSFLKQYAGRLEAIRDAATELDIPWRVALLDPFEPDDLLRMRPEEMAVCMRDTAADSAASEHAQQYNEQRLGNDAD